MPVTHTMIEMISVIVCTTIQKKILKDRSSATQKERVQMDFDLLLPGRIVLTTKVHDKIGNTGKKNHTNPMDLPVLVEKNSFDTSGRDYARWLYQHHERIWLSINQE